MTASPAFAIGADPGTAGLVKIYGKEGELLKTIQPYATGFTGGVRVTMADLNSDGTLDLVTSTGAGGGPNLRVYDGATGKLTASFFAYAPNYSGGVNIAAGDIGGGQMGIVTGTDGNGGPHVKVFSPTGETLKSFFAYTSSFTGGVKVALGYGPSGDPAIFSGAGAGAGPHVKAFDINSGKVVESYFAYDAKFRGGVSISTADFDGDGSSEVVTTPTKGAPHVKIFDGTTGKQLASFYGGPISSTDSAAGVVSTGLDHRISVLTKQHGVGHLAFFQVQDNGSVKSTESPFSGNGDSGGGTPGNGTGVISFSVPTPAEGSGLVAVGADEGSTPLVKVYDSATMTEQYEFLAYAEDYIGGVRVAVADVNGDGTDDIITGQGNQGTLIRIFNGIDGKQFQGKLDEFEAFPNSSSEGVYVAAGDVNGDGYADIVAGTDGGNGALLVRAYSGYSGSLIHEWNLASSGMAQGMRVAVGDVNGDGKGDVAVAGSEGGTSAISVFDGGNGAQIQNYFAFEATYTSGVSLTMGDANGDGYADVIAGEANGGSRVRVFSGLDTSTILSREFFSDYTGGIRIGTTDSDSDGKVEVVAVTAPGEGEGRVASMSAQDDLVTFDPFGEDYDNGLFVAGANRSSGGPIVTPFWDAPTVSIEAITTLVTEGGYASLKIIRTGDTSKSAGFSLSYSGTGTNGTGNDYYWFTGSAVPVGETSTTVSFPTFADSEDEGFETIVVTINGTAYCTTGSPSVAVVVLQDDDMISPTVPDPDEEETDTDIDDPDPESSNDGNSPTLPEPTCAADDGSVETAFGLDGFGRPSVSPGGVSYTDGSVTIPLANDLKVDGFGKGAGAKLTWSNQPGNSSSGSNGNNLVSPARPFLKIDSKSTVAVVSSGKDAYLFNSSFGSYTPRNYLQNALSYNSGSGLYTMTDTVGNKTEYYNFSTSLPSAQRGQVKRTIDTSGNTLDYTYNGSGQMTEYQRAVTVGSTTTTESFLYTYLSSGTNSGKVDTVTLRRKINSGSWDTVRSIQYTYYGTGSSNGNAGDLQLVESKDGAGNVIDTQYMRYYTSSSSIGYVGGLKYLFSGPSYDRLKGTYATPDTATDGQVDDYASAYYEYGAGQQISKAVMQGEGCPVCTGGLGEYTYSYTFSSFANGYNNWRTKTVETLPDGNQNIVYTNFIGETILKVFKDTTNSQEWPTYSRYDSQGRLILAADTAAISGYDETKADLLNNVSGDYQYIRNSAGLVTNYGFGISTTATTSTAGNVTGYLKSISIQQGETGTAIPQQDYTYIARTANSQTTYHPASSTVYRNTNGTGGQTTSMAYTWVSSSQQIESKTITLPTVTTAQNGPNSAASSTVFLDTFGRAIWMKDALGFLTYREFDQGTGAVTKVIKDVDTTQTGTFSNLPSGWSTPSGGGLHLITSLEVDSRGRTTKLTRPNGRIDYTVYKDATHEVRRYNGWDAVNLVPTGPIVVVRQDWINGYGEVLTMSATPSTSGSRPTGSESIGSLQSLSRSYMSIGGQVTNDDVYFDLSGLTYSTSTSFGTENTNFYLTAYRYDQRGRRTGVVMPTGTIYRSNLDSLGRKVSEWIGLDDTPTSGLWSPTNIAGTDMVKVMDYEYDNGGIGNSNITKITEIPGGSVSPRVKQVWYDWRNRSVVGKFGIEVSEASDVNRPIFYTDYDNLNELIKSRTYDGDNVSITTTNGVPDAPSSSLLRAQTESLYDEQNRVYRTLTYSVNSSTGTASSDSLTTNIWYDKNGQTIKASVPGGLVQKFTYNGAGRAVKSYVSDGGSDTSWSDADDVTNDNVLEQVEFSHDNNGNVILTTTKQHFHDDTGTGELGNASSGNKARVTYQAAYYDGADRLVNLVDVGTNGGSSYTRPGSVPSRSDTVLVTTHGYAASGLPQDVTDSKGILTKTTYDSLGRATRIVENYTNGIVTDTANKTTDYTYNAIGMIRVKVNLPSNGQQTTEWVYGISTSGGNAFNSNDLVKEVRYPDSSTGASSSADKDVITSNALGQKLTVSDRNGNVHTYTYDVLGRQATDAVTTLGSGVDGTVRLTTTAYDTHGIPYLFTSYDAVSGGSIVNQVKREFNGLGQLTKEWQEHSGAVTGSSSNVQYTYSEMASSANHSRLTSVIYASGYVINYNYASGLDNSISRLTSISDSSNTLESLTYLGLGIVVKRAHSQSGVDLSYIKLTGESTSDAGDQYIGLDRFGRTVDQRWINGSNVDIDRFKYSYDRNDNVLYKENTVNTGLSEVYTYDDLNQITSYKLGTLNGSKTDVTGSPTSAQSWDYDATGNWDSVTTNGVTQARGANKQNEITSVSSATTPTYDNNGNLTKDENNYRFVWDAWNRVAKIKNSSDTVIATNSYDGLNRKVKVVANSTTTDRIFSSNWQLLEERVGSSTKTRNVWSPVYVDAMVSRDRDTDGNGTLDERLYALQDANFNVTAITNTSGTVQERYTETPFGVTTFRNSSGTVIGSSAKDWVFLHQGGQADIIGNLDFRNRLFSPTLGRWLSNDPLGFAAGDTNIYRYSRNGPLGSLDPSGLDSTPAKPAPHERKPIKFGPGKDEKWNGTICLISNYETKDQNSFDMWIKEAKNTFTDPTGVPIIWAYIGNQNDIAKAINDLENGSIMIFVIGGHGSEESMPLNWFPGIGEGPGGRFGGTELLKNPGLCELMRQKTNKECIYRFEWCHSGENAEANKINSMCLQRPIIAANGCCGWWLQTPQKWSSGKDPKKIPGGGWIEIPYPPKEKKD